MIECRPIASVRAAVAAARGAGRRIGFVPTMGALHAGHTSLIDAARRRGEFIVVSIFVNPTQFAPNEDFSHYPRDEAGDLATCRAAGADAVFLPAVADMYPAGARTTVRVAGLSDTLCGPHRPGHFDGVATVVAKLFNIVQPDTAFFGQKDAQQLAVIRRMTRDLDLPIEIVGCPTVREPDGLAMSSRNAYLSPTERIQALCLHRALMAAQSLVEHGACDAPAIEKRMEEVLRAAGPVTIDYASLVNPDTMQPVDAASPPFLAAIAVRIGRTRLIDNLLVARAATR